MPKSKSDKEGSQASKNTVKVTLEPGQDPDEQMAQVILRPIVQAACTVRTYNSDKDDTGVQVGALIAELAKQSDTVQSGSLERAEMMLIAQAHSLDAIFGSLARRAYVQEYLPQYETFLKLALRAQGQCRATLETLATIKNPSPVAFVRQANIGQTVQVNNGTISPLRAEERENKPNELLEANDGKRLEQRAASASIHPGEELETVGALNGTENRDR